MGERHQHHAGEQYLPNDEGGGAEFAHQKRRAAHMDHPGLHPALEPAAALRQLQVASGVGAAPQVEQAMVLGAVALKRASLMPEDRRLR